MVEVDWGLKLLLKGHYAVGCKTKRELVVQSAQRVDYLKFIFLKFEYRTIRISIVVFNNLNDFGRRGFFFSIKKKRV